jgi:hypothetical protein
MPPKRSPPSSSTSNKRIAPRHGPLAPEEGTATGYLKTAYTELTAKENLGAVRAVGMFGVSLLFLVGGGWERVGRGCGVGWGGVRERWRGGRVVRGERW